MLRLLPVCLLALLVASPALAQSTGTQADHEALRKLKADATTALNARDYPAAQKLLHQPFTVTVVTQDSFSEMEKLKAFYEGLYTRDVLRLKQVALAADADELSQIYEGTFALTKGATKEHYELADGRAFDMNGRWTGVSIKENGQWKLLAVHMGINFLDNPVLAAIEKSLVWFTAAGTGLGMRAGFALGWFFRRSRPAA